MKYYGFYEPHQTGGHSYITISSDAIIKWMLDSYPDHSWKNDEEIIADFCAVNWASEISDIEAARPNHENFRLTVELDHNND
jgi:hypothetical protein